MSIALYRKYRPLCFNQVIGQKFTIQTLKHEIENKDTYHAYIFSGTRGSGKTSLARIFARSINCINLYNGDCCGKCENCLETLNSYCMDIHELDAASNSGVDEIRKLIDTVPYLPTKLSKKVYIIDEAHMLSNSAWNALLKTIEEPPKHITFIFVTTEINKIPPTIISRCQRFEFTKLHINELIELIDNICIKENILISNQAKIKIAQLADGSARDCLSILHQVNDYSNQNITIECINAIFGLMSLDFKINLLNNYFANININNLFYELETNVSNHLTLTQDLIDILLDKIVYLQTNDINLLKVLSIDNLENLNFNLDQALSLLEVMMSNYEKIKLYGNGLYYYKILFLNKCSFYNINDKAEVSDKKIYKQENIDNNIANKNIKSKPECVDCFETNEIVINKVNNEIKDNSYDNLALNELEIFSRIVCNENNEWKKQLNENLDKIKNNIESYSNPVIKYLVNCSKVLVASSNAALLLFSFKNEAIEFNKLFWDKNNYLEIKKHLLSDKDNILIAEDKTSIQKLKAEFMSIDKKNIDDANLIILEKIKSLSEEEKVQKILNILEEN